MVHLLRTGEFSLALVEGQELGGGGNRKAICLQISGSTIDNSFQVDYF